MEKRHSRTSRLTLEVRFAHLKQHQEPDECKPYSILGVQTMQPKFSGRLNDTTSHNEESLGSPNGSQERCFGHMHEGVN